MVAFGIANFVECWAKLFLDDRLWVIVFRMDRSSRISNLKILLCSRFALLVLLFFISRIADPFLPA